MKDPSILRVLRDETVVGAAFLVSKRLIATCAHVIKLAGSDKGGRVSLKLENGNITQAIVMDEYWRGVDAEDVAILRLENDLEGIQPLILSPSQVAIGYKFSTYGFPEATQELTGGGDIVGSAILESVKLLQLRSPEVTPGFSGAPIIVDSNQYFKRVVGMVVSIVPPDQYLRRQTTAFANSSETLHRICPEIPIEYTLEELKGELLALPGVDELDLSSARKAYKLCFNGISSLDEWKVSKMTINELVWQVVRAAPQQGTGAYSLAYFVATLADCLRGIKPQLSELLWTWLKKRAINLRADPGNLEELVHIDQEQVNPPCLQLILESYLDQRRFILKGRDARRNRKLFSDITCERNELASYVRQALKKIFLQLEDHEKIGWKDKLWIEFWLNTPNLSYRVDQWVADETGETLGQAYKVVTRSKYRWEKIDKLTEPWLNKWDACKAALSNQTVSLDRDVILEPKSPDLQNALERVQVIGLPFELRDDEANGQLLTSLLMSGVPIAIWMREGVDHQLAKQWLQEHIADNLDLRLLAEQVRLERKTGSPLGKAMVLLWDNYDHKLYSEENDSLVAPEMRDEEVPI